MLRRISLRLLHVLSNAGQLIYSIETMIENYHLAGSILVRENSRGLDVMVLYRRML